MRHGILSLLHALSFVVFCGVLTLFPGVSLVQDGTRSLLWVSPLSLQDAAAGEVQQPKSGGGAQDASVLEKKIYALLSPVYGEDHVVVQVSLRENEEGSRAAGPGAGERRAADRPQSRTIAVIIDAAVLQGIPTSAEGLRAEQERLCTLISHAVGLVGTSGDSVAVSFIRFQENEAGMTPLCLGLACCCVLLLAVLSVLRKFGRGGGSRKASGCQDGDKSHIYDRSGAERKAGMASGSQNEAGGQDRAGNAAKEKGAGQREAGEGGRTPEERLAGRMRNESPQACALIMTLVEDKEAAALFKNLPQKVRIGTACAMISQGTVREEVLELVGREYLSGYNADKDCLAEGMGSARAGTVEKLEAMLGVLPGEERAEIVQAVAGLDRELAQKLGQA